MFDHIRKAWKAVAAAAAPLLWSLAKVVADDVEQAVPSLALAVVSAFLTYMIPNRGPKAP